MNMNKLAQIKIAIARIANIPSVFSQKGRELLNPTKHRFVKEQVGMNAKDAIQGSNLRLTR